MPTGSYVLIEAMTSPSRESNESLALGVAEVASLVTLRHSHVLDEKLFEGIINTENSFVMRYDGPMRLTAAPAVTSQEVSDAFTRDFSSIQQLDSKERERLQLASRWFRRGHEAINQVDKYLFWWTVLEIYPGRGKSNIVKNIRRVLRERACPHLDVQTLEEKLAIGRIYGERKRIVHEGRAFVPINDRDFESCLERLRAIATVCLRLLGGLPPGGDLQQFVEESNAGSD